MSSFQRIVSPSGRLNLKPSADFARQTAIRRERDAEDRRRLWLAASVVCTGLIVAGIALWQARNARTVYVLAPSEPAAPTIAAFATPPMVREFVYTAQRRPAPVEGVVSSEPVRTAPRVATTGPAMPLTWTPPTPAAVDHAARDRQVQDLKSRIEALDEDVRRVREHPDDPRYYWHYASSTYRGIDQARRDAYLKELDQQRNDLRRQKWALEGR